MRIAGQTSGKANGERLEAERELKATRECFVFEVGGWRFRVLSSGLQFDVCGPLHMKAVC